VFFYLCTRRQHLEISVTDFLPVTKPVDVEALKETWSTDPNHYWTPYRIGASFFDDGRIRDLSVLFVKIEFFHHIFRCLNFC